MMEARSVWNHPAAFKYLERVLASPAYWGDFVGAMISVRKPSNINGQPSQVKGLRLVQPK
jgi:hypothetical protein